MKIRHLKKKKFVAVFRDYVTDWDNYEAVISYNNGWCCSAEWEYDNEIGKSIPVHVKTRKVDGKHIKEDTYYKLEDGKFVEV